MRVVNVECENGARGTWKSLSSCPEKQRGAKSCSDILTFERYRTNQKVKAKPIENSLMDDVGFK